VSVNQSRKWCDKARPRYIVCRPSTLTLVPPKYTPEIWAGVGRACLLGLLEIESANPWTRLPRSEYCSLDRARKSVAFQLSLDRRRRPVTKASIRGNTLTKSSQVSRMGAGVRPGTALKQPIAVKTITIMPPDMLGGARTAMPARLSSRTLMKTAPPLRDSKSSIDK
jgi:hypothetical protein